MFQKKLKKKLKKKIIKKVTKKLFSSLIYKTFTIQSFTSTCGKPIKNTVIIPSLQPLTTNVIKNSQGFFKKIMFLFLATNRINQKNFCVMTLRSLINSL